jgi:hypothetical protein
LVGYPEDLRIERNRMDLLGNLAFDSITGFIGLALLAIGGFMILAGVGIISIQQVTVKQGRITWVLGLAMAAVGLVLLLPEFLVSSDVPDTQIPVVETQPTATLSSSDPSGSLAEWVTIAFVIPDDGLWLEEDGRYSAIGSTDTIAWSDELFGGDIELSLDIESSTPLAAASIVAYGDGKSQASGNLIFTIANDLQAILADSIYDDGTYLFASTSSVDFGEQTHALLIRIIDRKASLILDGEEIASVLLDENINTSGKIGLLKWGGIHDVTFSNARIRGSEPVE